MDKMLEEASIRAGLCNIRCNPLYPLAEASMDSDLPQAIIDKQLPPDISGQVGSIQMGCCPVSSCKESSEAASCKSCRSGTTDASATLLACLPLLAAKAFWRILKHKVPVSHC